MPGGIISETLKALSLQKTNFFM